jgi:hypothetical protein
MIKKKKQNLNITNKKIMNLLNMKNTIKLHGKKTKTKALVNVQTKMNMKKNTNMKMNAMLQMERWRCSFAGYPGDQIKVEVQKRAATRRVPRKPPTLKCEASHS